jgi:ATP-dependent Clp protease ATP-binding subunit ClpB
VDLQLERVAVLVRELGITMQVSEEAKAFLARKGFDPVFGARPLKRAIQREVQDPLSRLLLEEEIADGSRVAVSVHPEGDRLAFEPTSGAVPALPAQAAPV